MNAPIPIPTLHLFQVLDQKLLELLKSLSPAEWESQTVAKLWKVKDVAAHLLDGNLRTLSMSRDRYFGEKADNVQSYDDLICYLNELNRSWVQAMKRVSPTVLIDLLESSGKEYISHLETLPPFENALFSVAWAGQQTSPNWFHIAREYTEKFLHQQQIRDAVNKPGIMTSELFGTFMEVVIQAFPYTFQKMEAKNGTVVSLEITTEIGGIWSIIQAEDSWKLIKNPSSNPSAKVSMDPNTAWKLISKSWKPEDVKNLITISGDPNLGMKVLEITSFMVLN
ncbi:maleylpyruvate isomerase N-terminal domain-containing protein [Algoriphagus litoralis]|uniref:maleylpyruvate isomerase N-terminal domain-containing protein n=1 Tax=Algoriphagus litoralis TaxID=2202829 RepID=UPI000DBAC41A|nr:maleylpyruvate isomerase N-terminal domain-containing protein [Algoriphagus litoralis]